ncbi:hypothetical protein [Vibrio mediterranei]|nr:hypothetical protein [Vibrio mediterranei]
MKKTTYYKLLIISSISLMSISGCSQTSNIEPKEEIEQTKQAINELISNTNTRDKNNIDFVNDFFIKGQRISVNKNVQYEKINISMISNKKLQLDEAINPIIAKGFSVDVIDNCSFISEEKETIVDYKGNISGYLDYLKKTFNYDARIVRNKITFEKCQDYIVQLPGNTFSSKMNMSIDVIKGSPISGAHSQDDIDSVVSTIQTILKEEGDVILSKRTGHLRILARPDKIQSIKQFIGKLMENQEKQVSIDVKIVQYSGDESAIFGLSGKLNYAGNGYSGSISSPNTNSDATASTIKGTIASGKFSDSELLLSSLYGNKNVSITSSINLVGINSSPLPFNVSTKRNYVRSIKLEYDKDKKTETKSYEVDSVQSGLELLILPTVDELDNIDMTVMIKQKELLKISKYENIQLPETTENSSFQRMRLQSGDTLVLTGFDENRLNDNRDSTVPGVLILGGNVDKKMANRKIAILISPKVI